MEENIIVQRAEDGVATVTLNRPEVRNAIDGALHFALLNSLVTLNGDPQTRVVILRGAGNDFCSGGDVKAFGTERSLLASMHVTQVRSPTAHFVMTMLELEVPIIAQVHGAALGFGCTLAMMCDLAIADESARFGDPHITLGIVPGDGATVVWPTLAGERWAKRALLTGETFDAATAVEIGLVNEVVDHTVLASRVTDYARSIAGHSAFAVRATKVALNRTLGALAKNEMEYSLAIEQISRTRTQERGLTSL